MKIWIDDIRTPPSKGWIWVKTSSSALDVLDKNRNQIEMISFDHDLGGEDTAYVVANWIEAEASTGRFTRIKWQVHSMNVVGRQRISAAMKSAERFWDGKDSVQKG